MRANDDFITPARLKDERGWTDGLITKFLGEPDKTATNPHYRSGSPMRLYAMARVIETEATAAFQKSVAEKAASRTRLKQRAVDAANKRRNDLLSAIAGLQVSVIKLPTDQLRDEAIRHYNDLWAARGKWEKRASTGDSPEFLARIMHNYIRHSLVTLMLPSGDEHYRDEIVESLKGAVGRSDAYLALWEKVTKAITEAYPGEDFCLQNPALAG